jgi:hypothetical protein
MKKMFLEFAVENPGAHDSLTGIVNEGEEKPVHKAPGLRPFF